MSPEADGLSSAMPEKPGETGENGAGASLKDMLPIPDTSVLEDHQTVNSFGGNTYTLPLTGTERPPRERRCTKET